MIMAIYYGQTAIVFDLEIDQKHSKNRHIRQILSNPNKNNIENCKV
jgi:hypothetical protein